MEHEQRAPVQPSTARRSLRSGLMLALALAQPVAGRFGHRSGGARSIEARSAAVRGPLTPPKGAFAIWGPIFAGNVCLALRACLGRERASAVDRRLAWGLGAIAWRNARERRPRVATAASVGVAAVLLATLIARQAGTGRGQEQPSRGGAP